MNYPNVRTFFTGLEYAAEPQHDLISVLRNWALPTPGNIHTHQKTDKIFSRLVLTNSDSKADEI